MSAELSPGSTLCGNGCANLATSFFNCGGCGNVCGVGQICISGTCQGGGLSGLLTVPDDGCLKGVMMDLNDNIVAGSSIDDNACSSNDTASGTVGTGGKVVIWEDNQLDVLDGTGGFGIQSILVKCSLLGAVPSLAQVRTEYTSSLPGSYMSVPFVPGPSVSVIAPFSCVGGTFSWAVVSN